MRVDEAKSDSSGKHVSLSKVPVHDWASHPADAFRTTAVMIREPEKKKRDGEAPARGQAQPVVLRSYEITLEGTVAWESSQNDSRQKTVHKIPFHQNVRP